MPLLLLKAHAPIGPTVLLMYHRDNVTVDAGERAVGGVITEVVSEIADTASLNLPVITLPIGPAAFAETEKVNM